MSFLSSPGITLCEPTHLYNILSQCSKAPAVVDEGYLLLLDARDRVPYNEGHVILAKHAKKDDQGTYCVPFGVHLPTTLHCVVYDTRTVSTVEDSDAVRLANALATSGSQNQVMVVKGGYERFSAEYPFLRTIKIMFTPMELERLPLYPSEILPLFLYLGDRRHAYNASLNYDLKIHAHLNMSSELHTAYPGMIHEQRVEVPDSASTNLLSRFEEIYEFIDSHRKKSERVMVFGDLGISRAATAVIAYLIKRNKWTLKEALTHVRGCRRQTQPLQAFIHQLSQWEAQVHGSALTDVSQL